MASATDPLVPARTHLAPEPDLAATCAWAAHCAAGRIGPPAAPPPPGEHRLASLAAILGAGPRNGGAA